MKLNKIFLLLACSLLWLNAATIKIGTNANFPPFEYVDDSLKIVGFDIDLINEFAKRANLNYEIVNMGFDALIPALKTGKIDAAISGMSATEDRKRAVDFSNPYYETQTLYIKKADNDKINSKDDVKDKKIGVQLGVVQEIAARELSKNVAPTKDPIASIMALKSSKVDIVMIDSSVGYGYLKNNSDLVGFYEESDGSDGFAIAFDKGKKQELIEKFNSALKEMKEDGTYDLLLKKYKLK